LEPELEFDFEWDLEPGYIFWKNNRDWNLELTINLKQKSNKRSMAETIPWETKKGPRKAKSCTAQRLQKEGESYSLSHDRKSSHPQAF
jgi:hypothetical protein